MSNPPFELPEFIKEYQTCDYVIMCNDGQEVGNEKIGEDKLLKNHREYNVELNRLCGRIDALERYCHYLEHIIQLDIINALKLSPEFFKE